MSDTTPKPGLLGFSDSPEDAARKLGAAFEADAAANAAAIFGESADNSTTSTTSEA